MQTLPIQYFRSRIDGPEMAIEDAVVQRLSEVFGEQDWPLWLGGSVPLGSGFPDIVSAWYDPQVISLADFATEDGHILAYLRSVRRAKSRTVAEKLRYSNELVEEKIEALERFAIVDRHRPDSYSISAVWREILPEVITVEAKVRDWRAALQQAIRNGIFAHRSFVALPRRVAERIDQSSGFAIHGVGILSVDDDGCVEILREARRCSPRVWHYYFHLAAIAATDIRRRSS